MNSRQEIIRSILEEIFSPQNTTPIWGYLGKNFPGAKILHNPASLESTLSGVTLFTSKKKKKRREEINNEKEWKTIQKSENDNALGMESERDLLRLIIQYYFLDPIDLILEYVTPEVIPLKLEQAIWSSSFMKLWSIESVTHRNSIIEIISDFIAPGIQGMYEDEKPDPKFPFTETVEACEIKIPKPRENKKQKDDYGLAYPLEPLMSQGTRGQLEKDANRKYLEIELDGKTTPYTSLTRETFAIANNFYSQFFSYWIVFATARLLYPFENDSLIINRCFAIKQLTPEIPLTKICIKHLPGSKNPICTISSKSFISDLKFVSTSSTLGSANTDQDIVCINSHGSRFEAMITIYGQKIVFSDGTTGTVLEKIIVASNSQLVAAFFSRLFTENIEDGAWVKIFGTFFETNELYRLLQTSLPLESKNTLKIIKKISDFTEEEQFIAKKIYILQQTINAKTDALASLRTRSDSLPLKNSSLHRHKSDSKGQNLNQSKTIEDELERAHKELKEWEQKKNPDFARFQPSIFLPDLNSYPQKQIPDPSSSASLSLSASTNSLNSQPRSPSRGLTLFSAPGSPSSRPGSRKGSRPGSRPDSRSKSPNRSPNNTPPASPPGSHPGSPKVVKHAATRPRVLKLSLSSESWHP